MEIKIKYHDHKLMKVTPISCGDWLDLRTAEDVVLHLGQRKTISLGISVQLPDGYEAHIVPRSSTFQRYGLIQTNGVGIIDNSYCGDNDIWGMPVFCLGKLRVKIPKNTRIAQFRIVKKQPEFEINKVDSLGNEDRGGFGSTGE